MDDHVFNMEVRKFLKQVGIISQREVDRAVQNAVVNGRIKGDEMVKARACMQIVGLGLDHETEAKIALS